MKKFSIAWKNEPEGRGIQWDRVLFVVATVALLIRLGFWLSHVDEKTEADVASEAPLLEEPLPPPPAQSDVWTPPAVVEPERLPLSLPEPVVPPPELAPSPPPPEEFHFRQTRWGMTMEEVRAAEPGLPVREGERGLLYAVTTLELPSLVNYAFVQGRLVRARLMFSDPTGTEIPPLSMAQAQRRFLFLREELRSRYGEPMERTTSMKRDVSVFSRQIQKQDEMARQYDVEIAEAEERLQKERTVLENRFSQWVDRADRVKRGMAPLERDLRDLRTWKQEALEQLHLSQKSLEEQQVADFLHPLVGTRKAFWKDARGFHDIELKLDFRGRVPRLDIRYEGRRMLDPDLQMNEL